MWAALAAKCRLPFLLLRVFVVIRLSDFIVAALLTLALLTTTVPARAQVEDQEILTQLGENRDEVTFSTETGPQYIVVRDFKITEVQPTGKDDEYALTLLALTQRGEPDQRVMGGILFEIDGKSTIVPFQQGGVGDVTVTARPGADEIALRAVDSNVTHTAELPTARRTPWVIGGGLIVVLLILAARRRRARQGQNRDRA